MSDTLAVFIGAAAVVLVAVTVRLLHSGKQRETSEKQSLNIDEPQTPVTPPKIDYGGCEKPAEPTAQYVSEPPYKEVAPLIIPEPETTPIETPNKPIRKHHKKKHNR